MRAALSASVTAALLLMPARVVTAPLTFTVNSPADVPDVNPGNGVCETAPGNDVCTLRGAIQETNANAGADTINLQANVTYLLTRVGAADDNALNGDLDITNNVTIIGAGASGTIIDGNGNLTGERVFHITRCAGGVTAPCVAPMVSVSGVTIQHGKNSLVSGGLENGGGGIYSEGTLTLSSVTVVNNTGIGGASGGGIQNKGPLTLTHSTVMNNTSTGGPAGAGAAGGGINNQGPLTITNSTISGNTAFGRGGGINTVSFAMTMKNSTISGNTAEDGGGIYALHSLVVINSTISGNHSTRSGGGIYVNQFATGATSLFNVTITQNLANADGIGTGIGGGVVVESGATLTFQNSIIALNQNTFDSGPFQVINDDDCAGTITSHGNNIMNAIDAGYCTVNPPVTVANPNLGPLEQNGGPTQTHALLAGSPAIDAGNAGGCTDNLGATLQTDQRGAPRPFPFGGRCDVGAVESSRGFTDDPLAAGGSVILAVHIRELRTRIDAQRTRFGLSPFAWTGAPLAGTPVLAIHVSELRTALQDAYINAVRAPPTFTDSPLAPRTTVIKALHIEELRDAVVLLEGS